MWGKARKARTNSKVKFFNGPIDMYVPVSIDEQKPIYIRSVWIYNVVWKI